MAGEKKAEAVKPKAKQVKKSRAKAPSRLYSKGTILGYKRSKSNCYATCTLVAIDGVRTKEEASWYFGKRIAYIYRAKKEIKGTKFRVMWGKVRRAHGSSGVVRTKWHKNIPPRAFGAQCRIMMYPSRI